MPNEESSNIVFPLAFFSNASFKGATEANERTLLPFFTTRLFSSSTSIFCKLLFNVTFLE
ncbi:Uncharacterised protein [Chlamydia abortus]|nr:Uncharacterised protein [Chlamydia abortus]SGA32374.1 Uncharacterised protein [Chlamydia abortus]